MTRRSKTLLALGLGTTALLVLTGFRWAGWGGCERNPERAHQVLTWKVNDALDAVEATDAQRAQVHAIKDELFQEAMRLRAEHRGTREVLLEQWSSATPDAARLHRLVDERVEAVRAFAHRAVDGLLRVHGLLTPAQREEAAARMRERMGHGR